MNISFKNDVFSTFLQLFAQIQLQERHWSQPVMLSDETVKFIHNKVGRLCDYGPKVALCDVLLKLERAFIQAAATMELICYFNVAGANINYLISYR